MNQPGESAHRCFLSRHALYSDVVACVTLETRGDEASTDLGADYPTTLRRVILPMIAPAVAAAWLVAFTASFDEFALALFLSGPEPTFPVFFYGQLRFASRFPILIALAVLVMVGTLTLAFLADRLRNRVRFLPD